MFSTLSIYLFVCLQARLHKNNPTHYILVWSWIRGQIQELSFTFFNIVRLKVFQHFSISSWKKINESVRFSELMTMNVCEIWCGLIEFMGTVTECPSIILFVDVCQMVFNTLQISHLPTVTKLIYGHQFHRVCNSLIIIPNYITSSKRLVNYLIIQEFDQ